jgi:GLPGLI family protein
MKNIFIVLMICLSPDLSSQNKAGFAIYNLYFNMDEEIMEGDKKFGYIQMAIDAAKETEYKLNFKNNEANFYQVPNLDLDKLALNMLNIMAGTPKNLYLSLDKRIVVSELNSDGFVIKANEFVVLDSLSFEWKITNETKKIGEYICYKANAVKKGKDGFETIVAWFCPKLPFSFGPSKYGGLPGLILELHERNVAFVIKSFTLKNENEIGITIPKAKKTLTQDDYFKMLQERYETLESMTKKSN